MEPLSDKGVTATGSREALAAWGATAAACLYYLFLLTNGSFDLFTVEALGVVFDRMAWHLLHWRFTIEPEIIGREAFVWNGETYAYFGIFPALLRIPLVLIHGPEPLNVSRLSCWLGLSTIAIATTATVLTVNSALPRFPGRRAAVGIVLCAMLLTTPLLGLNFSAYIYNEPIVWSVAFATLMLMLLARQVVAAMPPTPGRWVALGALTGLALLARPIAGIAMAVALGLAVLLAEAPRLPEARVALRARLARILQAGCWAAAGLLPLVALVMAVNYLRWGNPFEFSPQTANIQVIEDARRMRANVEYGVFELARVPLGIGYYFFGLLNDRLTGPLAARLMDDQGWPRSALLATSTTQLAMMALGFWALLRGRLPPALGGLHGVCMLAMPLTIACLLLPLSIMNYRYRLEFFPLLLVGSLLGLAALATFRDATRRRLVGALALLVCMNVAVSHLDLLQAKLASFAQPEAERVMIIERTWPFSRVFVPAPPSAR